MVFDVAPVPNAANGRNGQNALVRANASLAAPMPWPAVQIARFKNERAMRNANGGPSVNAVKVGSAVRVRKKHENAAFVACSDGHATQPAFGKNGPTATAKGCAPPVKWRSRRVERAPAPVFLEASREHEMGNASGVSLANARAPWGHGKKCAVAQMMKIAMANGS